MGCCMSMLLMVVCGVVSGVELCWNIYATNSCCRYGQLVMHRSRRFA